MTVRQLIRKQEDYRIRQGPAPDEYAPLVGSGGIVPVVGRSYFYAHCGACGRSVKVFVWSMAGHGIKVCSGCKRRLVYEVRFEGLKESVRTNPNFADMRVFEGKLFDYRAYERKLRDERKVRLSKRKALRRFRCSKCGLGFGHRGKTAKCVSCGSRAKEVQRW